ncbi:MAG: Stp1/IreP family PP2C-type Ser/Thr phosphatase, partial [Pseudomonadota bacterium]|nr:Stp1/IreP family PP2C-type Ser/Thr phosphatase [Pseudomonadota bacterium]
DEALGLVVLADGMGGYQAGEVASKIAVETIRNELTKPLKTLSRNKRDTKRGFHCATVLLEQAIIKANERIYDTARQQTFYQGMGTTIVAALFHGDCVSVAHVGDSRLYRLRGHELIQITKDHSVRQELIDCGFYTPEQARNSPNKNLVTRALGVSRKVSVELQEHPVLAQDVYLLCSDGLNDMLDDEDMQLILTEPHHNLAQAAQSLIEAANNRGGEDNISVILASPLCTPLPKPQRRWWPQLLKWWR